MKKIKLSNEVILELLQRYGAVKVLLVVTFSLLRHLCDHSYALIDSWVSFAEILVNLNAFGTKTM